MMRYFEIASGYRMPISSEEQELLSKSKQQPLAKEQMDEREQEVARLMVSRGLMNYFKQDGQVFYRPNSIDLIWRDRDAC